MKITNEDNMELMARYPDNYFDLAIVDPPYGINVTKMTLGNGKNKINRGLSHWDKTPPKKEYFIELKRVSKNQIVWGCNYFDGLLWSSGRISWFKNVGADNDYSDCELAMNSFNNKVTNVKVDWSGFIMPSNERGIKRIHPTQKPIQLYEWLLMKYAKQGDKILDTHLGSGSIAIACHNLGYDLTACELDKDYFDAAMKRIEDHKKQLRMF